MCLYSYLQSLIVLTAASATKCTVRFFQRQTKRAHKLKDLAPLFIRAAEEVQKSILPNPRPCIKPSQSTDKEQLSSFIIPIILNILRESQSGIMVKNTSWTH